MRTALGYDKRDQISYLRGLSTFPVLHPGVLCMTTTSADWTRERQRRLELKELYDDYADTYEGDLLGADGKGGKGSLGYRTPNHLEDALRSRPGRLAADVEAGVLSRLDALDLGCGTGLMGVLLRPHCRGRLVGCDLSKRMLKVGAASHPGVYDDLVAAECVSFLSARPPASADLVVAADVFPYLRCLSDVAAAAQAALCVGGVFCFSTEACRLGRAVATSHASTHPSIHPSIHPSVRPSVHPYIRLLSLPAGSTSAVSRALKAQRHPAPVAGGCSGRRRSASRTAPSAPAGLKGAEAGLRIWLRITPALGDESAPAACGLLRRGRVAA